MSPRRTYASELVDHVELHAIDVAIKRRVQDDLINPLREKPVPLQRHAISDLITDGRHVCATIRRQDVAEIERHEYGILFDARVVVGKEPVAFLPRLTNLRANPVAVLFIAHTARRIVHVVEDQGHRKTPGRLPGEIAEHIYQVEAGEESYGLPRRIAYDAVRSAERAILIAGDASAVEEAAVDLRSKSAQSEQDLIRVVPVVISHVGVG